MQQIAFAGLGAQSCAIIDAGSLDTFLNPDVIRWANSDELVRYAENRRTDGWSPDTMLKEIFTIIEGRNQIKETLLFLEKLVVYDTLVFDAMAPVGSILTTSRARTRSGGETCPARRARRSHPSAPLDSRALGFQATCSRRGSARAR